MNSQINHSYFYAFDSEKCWNWTIYFSYWNDFHREDEGSKYIESTALILLTVISLCVNSSFVFLFCMQRELRTITNIFILNVCAAGILLLPFTLMIAITRNQTEWNYGDVGCHFTMLGVIVPPSAIIWTMALISIERLRKIVYPHKRKITPRQAYVMAFCITWMVPFVSYIPMSSVSVLSKTVLTPNGERQICTTITPYHPRIRMSILFGSLILILHYLIPVVIMTVSYVITLRALKRTSEDVIRGRHWDYKRKRAIVMLIIMMTTTIFMWLPTFGVLAHVIIEKFQETYRAQSRLFTWVVAIMVLNTITDILLYTLTSTNYCKLFKKTCFSRRSHTNYSSNVSTMQKKNDLVKIHAVLRESSSMPSKYREEIGSYRCSSSEVNQEVMTYSTETPLPRDSVSETRIDDAEQRTS